MLPGNLFALWWSNLAAVHQLTRGIGPLERAVEDWDDPEATLVRGYAVAVR